MRTSRLTQKINDNSSSSSATLRLQLDGLQRRLDEMVYQAQTKPAAAMALRPLPERATDYRQRYVEQELGGEGKYYTPCGACCGPGFLVRNCTSGASCCCRAIEIGGIAMIWGMTFLIPVFVYILFTRFL